MAKNWIVVANNTKAKIFTLAPPAPRLKDTEALQPPTDALSQSRLVEFQALEHPEGRLKSQSIDADRPGRSFESAGMKRHAMSREVDPKKQEAITFARQVAERLEGARLQGEVERLILVAAPEFLGLLRDNMTSELRRMIEEEFSLDLVQMTAHDIRAHLPETLFPAK
ncbi:MAG TPA: host attachment protein [Candidatus Binatia bacterium]|nr:host attachment protein [Candidatus Binatia bacterium]